MSSFTQAVIFSQYPSGMIKESDFTIEKEIPFDLEQDLQQDEVLFELIHLSIDAAMRMRMNGGDDPKTHPFTIGKPLNGPAIAKILRSKHSNFKEGCFVFGFFNWQKHQVMQIVPEMLPMFIHLDHTKPIPLSHYLSVLVTSGLSAYFGLLEICQPKTSEVVVVSAASGGVGNIVGQIAKLKGCKVIGISGSVKNRQQLLDLGFDHVLNYKDFNGSEALKEEILKVCQPGSGVDCYFDNAGGQILDAVTMAMNKFGRICLCGSIQDYNTDAKEKNLGPRLNSVYVVNELKVQGFMVGSFFPKFQEGMKELSEWLKEGKLKVLETKFEGIDNVPKAVISLFTGEKIGKVVVDI